MQTHRHTLPSLFTKVPFAPKPRNPGSHPPYYPCLPSPTTTGHSQEGFLPPPRHYSKVEEEQDRFNKSSAATHPAPMAVATMSPPTQPPPLPTHGEVGGKNHRLLAGSAPSSGTNQRQACAKGLAGWVGEDDETPAVPTTELVAGLLPPTQAILSRGRERVCHHRGTLPSHLSQSFMGPRCPTSKRSLSSNEAHPVFPSLQGSKAGSEGYQPCHTNPSVAGGQPRATALSQRGQAGGEHL